MLRTASLRPRPRVPRSARSTRGCTARSWSTWAAASTPASTSRATRRPTATGSGGDVADLVRELGVPVLRYPGGNFVSGYNWEDGIGPVGRAAHPARPGLALDRDQPGRRRRVRDVGHGGGQRADDGGQPRHPGHRRGAQPGRVLQPSRAAPHWSDLRRGNGAADPYGIKLWCLGNEMDGPWQIGHKTAARVRPAGRRDGARPCGWSTRRSSWSRAAARTAGCRRSAAGRRPSCAETYDVVDYVSLHSYYEQRGDDRDSFLACAVDMDRFIEAVVATADHARAVGPAQASGSTSRSTSGTSGTRAGSPARRTWRSAQTPAPDRGRLLGGRRRGRRQPADQPAAARRPGEDRLPGPAGQRDRADHDRAGRTGVAADQLPPVRPDVAARPRHRAARRAGRPAARDGGARRGPAAGRRGGATPRTTGAADAVRGQPRPAASRWPSTSTCGRCPT